MSRKNSTLSIIGLVLAILAIVFGFIPCLGLLAFIPGIIALILGGIALAQAKDSGAPRGMPIAILVISAIAIIASAYQAYYLYNLSKDVNSEVVQYDNCEDLEREINRLVKEMEALEDDEDSAEIGAIMNATFKLVQYSQQAEKLNCDIDASVNTSNTNNDQETDTEIDLDKDADIDSLQ